MITVNVKQLRLGENYYQIPYSVIKEVGIKEDLPFIVKDFNDDKEIGCFIVREIRDTWSPIIPIDKSKNQLVGNAYKKFQKCRSI